MKHIGTLLNSWLIGWNNDVTACPVTIENARGCKVYARPSFSLVTSFEAIFQVKILGNVKVSFVIVFFSSSSSSFNLDDF